MTMRFIGVLRRHAPARASARAVRCGGVYGRAPFRASPAREGRQGRDAGPAPPALSRSGRHRRRGCEWPGQAQHRPEVRRLDDLPSSSRARDAVEVGRRCRAGASRWRGLPTMRRTSASICCAVPRRTARSCPPGRREDRAPRVVVADDAERVAHAVLGDHRPRNVAGALQVVLCARGHSARARSLRRSGPPAGRRAGGAGRCASSVAIFQRQLASRSERAKPRATIDTL